jgi:hypothetical protein
VVVVVAGSVVVVAGCFVLVTGVVPATRTLSARRSAEERPGDVEIDAMARPAMAMQTAVPARRPILRERRRACIRPLRTAGPAGDSGGGEAIISSRQSSARSAYDAKLEPLAM